MMMSPLIQPEDEKTTTKTIPTVLGIFSGDPRRIGRAIKTLEQTRWREMERKKSTDKLTIYQAPC